MALITSSDHVLYRTSSVFYFVSVHVWAHYYAFGVCQKVKSMSVYIGHVRLSYRRV